MSYVSTVEPGSTVKLKDFETRAEAGLDRDDAEERVEKLGREMEDLHDLLFAAGTHALLIVLQGRDTSGKDGLIRHLLRYINAQSCQVVPFKVPTAEELAHDFLWRVHAHTPGRGAITVFNRSHYEDVLAVRVHDLAPERVWRPRFEHINHFERNLVDADTVVLKYFLHISKEEQEERLLAREQETEKAWKLSVGDWREREKWADYTRAFEEALERCSTPYAPWHVVPADHKWYRNLAVTDSIVRALRPLRDDWMRRLEQVGQQAKAALAEYRRQGGSVQEEPAAREQEG